MAARGAAVGSGVRTVVSVTAAGVGVGVCGVVVGGVGNHRSHGAHILPGALLVEIGVLVQIGVFVEIGVLVQIGVFDQIGVFVETGEVRAAGVGARIWLRRIGIAGSSAGLSAVSKVSVVCEPSLAHATAGLPMPYPVAAATPTPSATANAPTRPI